MVNDLRKQHLLLEHYTNKIYWEKQYIWDWEGKLSTIRAHGKTPTDVNRINVLCHPLL